MPQQSHPMRLGLLAMLALIGLSLNARAAAAIDRFEPASWWIGFKDPSLQILVHGPKIGALTPKLDYPGVKLVGANPGANANYLFIDLEISPSAKPGLVEIAFQRKGRTLERRRLDLRARDTGALHVQGLSNLGGKPNSFAGTLEGIDNIEVADARPKLFELWLEQRFAQDRIQLGIGFFDLNASFYSNDAAGLFISPPFGIGSELASTGPSGPSIFPSTALGFSARAQISDSLYAQGAVVDASAGVLGDAGGYQASLDDGVLLIGEIGAQDGQRGKIAVGFWGYSNKQPRLLVREDEPETIPAQGVYLLAELQLNHPREDVRMLRAFARIGASDADTTPFAGGAQAGLHLARPLANRPDSAFGIGVHYGAISSAARILAAQDGLAPSRGEYGIEITYADQLSPWLSIQPDVQILFHPGGDRQAPVALVAGLRLTLAFARGG